MMEMMSPRWMTNCESRAVRVYELRPCHSISRATCMNLVIEKSAASDACRPSFPSIPTPTSAAWIMATSLPPSPMAAQRLLACRLRSRTISAFCVGAHLQQTTEGQSQATSMNWRGKLSVQSASERPSITKQAPVFFWKRANCSSASALVLAERWKMVAPRAKRREEMAMHVAVSTLSPVSIHTRTPALRSVSSVVLTRSCSLSSTPVSPRSSKLHSSSSTAERIDCSRS
mmetsp:Transcript_9780/g.23236  ORF Transcript_9780/g.23236 Transcript_9780/m.23236 type:complete len:230 (-) Transcript_9780:1999-2688(-)